MAQRSALAELIRKIEFESATPEFQANILYTDAMEGTAVTEWVDKVSFWEEGMDQYAMRNARYQFASEILQHGTSEEVMQVYFRRWENAEFSIVGRYYVGIDNIWVNIPSSHSLPMKIERDIASDEAREGRTDMSLMMLQQYQWGTTSDNHTMIGVRAKIPGTRFVKVGKRMIGDIEFDVPEDFPVTLAERYGDKYYILRPHACPGFVFEGRKYERHPFVAPCEFVKERWHEGIMILTNQGEVRSKYLPTVDQNLAGEVWECTYQNGPAKVRPRPGKTGQNISLIFNAVVPAPVMAKDSSKLQRVVEVVCDRFTTGKYAKGTTMYIDSGLRMDLVKGYPVPIQQASFVQQVEEKVLNTIVGEVVVRNPRDIRRQLHKGSYKPQVLGAKVLLMDSTGQRCFLIKEQGKSVDMVGGKLEFGESPDQALLREIKEETGLDYTDDMIVPLGYSDAEDDVAFYRSYLYVARGKNWGETCVVRPILSPESGDDKSVLWLPRLVRDMFRNRTVTMINDFINVKEGSSTGRPSDVHEIIMREGKIKEGRLKTMLARDDAKITMVQVDHWARKYGLIQKFDWYHLQADEIPVLLRSFKQPQYEPQNVSNVRTAEKGGWQSNFPYTNPELLKVGDVMEKRVNAWCLANKVKLENEGKEAWVSVVKYRNLLAQEKEVEQQDPSLYVPPHKKRS